MKFIKPFVLLCCLVMGLNANAGIISYDIQNGKLMGASGIEINGELYSVTFENSCFSAYAGCDASLFDFTTQADAVTALVALFAQVFVDNVMVGGIQYNFDTKPELINSCDVAGFCEIWVPYQLAGNGNVTSAWHVNVTNNDYVGSNAWTGHYNYGDTQTYMAFTNFSKVTVSQVSAPGSLAIFALGLAGFMARRFKKA